MRLLTQRCSTGNSLVKSTSGAELSHWRLIVGKLLVSVDMMKRDRRIPPMPALAEELLLRKGRVCVDCV